MNTRATGDLTPERPGQPVDSCIMVIFGASGDLTKRKLIPALFNLAKEDYLPQDFALVGVARTPMSSEEFRAKITEDVKVLYPDDFE